MRHEHARAGCERLDDLTDNRDQLQLARLLAQVNDLVLRIRRAASLENEKA
jgi:hypothetical protein